MIVPIRSNLLQRCLAGLLIAGLLALVWANSSVLLPFVLSFILAYVLKPLIERTVERRVPRSLAIGLWLCLVLMLTLVVIMLLVPIVSQLVPMLRSQVPPLLERLWAVATPWLSQWGVHVPASMAEARVVAMPWVTDHAGQWASAFLDSLLSGGSNVMGVLGTFVLVPMLAFYWLMDWPRLTELGWGLLPPRWRVGVADVLDECDEVMGQYLRGQLLVMLVLAVFYSVGLALCGFHLALPIGVFTGLAVCIPYLGFGIGLVLALLSGVLQFSAAGGSLLQPLLSVAVVYGLGQVLEGFFLTPRLVGERIGLHPLAVIFFLMLFGQWFGFVGVLVALPVSALLVVLGRRVLLAYRASFLYQRASDSVQD